MLRYRSNNGSVWISELYPTRFCWTIRITGSPLSIVYQSTSTINLKTDGEKICLITKSKNTYTSVAHQSLHWAEPSRSAVHATCVESPKVKGNMQGLPGSLDTVSHSPEPEPEPEPAPAPDVGQFALHRPHFSGTTTLLLSTWSHGS